MKETLSRWIKTTKLLVTQGDKFMADLNALKAKVDAIVALVPAIAEDYATLKALIEDWKKKAEDPTLQSQVDAIVAKLDASLTALRAVDETVPNPVPEPPTGV